MDETVSPQEVRAILLAQSTPRLYEATLTTQAGHTCIFTFDLDDFYDFLQAQRVTPSPEIIAALDAPWASDGSASA